MVDGNIAFEKGQLSISIKIISLVNLLGCTKNKLHFRLYLDSKNDELLEKLGRLYKESSEDILIRSMSFGDRFMSTFKLTFSYELWKEILGEQLSCILNVQYENVFTTIKLTDMFADFFITRILSDPGLLRNAAIRQLFSETKLQEYFCCDLAEVQEKNAIEKDRVFEIYGKLKNISLYVKEMALSEDKKFLLGLLKIDNIPRECKEVNLVVKAYLNDKCGDEFELTITYNNFKRDNIYELKIPISFFKTSKLPYFKKIYQRVSVSVSCLGVKEGKEHFFNKKIASINLGPFVICSFEGVKLLHFRNKLA